MRFQSDKVAFGRHETFPLRYGWLPKGFRAIQKDPKAFDSEDATTTLGVGKNMVRSIRYWLLATSVAENNRFGLVPTQLGRSLLTDDGWDPYLEDDATIWLLHWMLSSAPDQATVNFWFFNHFHKTVFSGQEAQTAFIDFCKENVKARFAATTAKKDAAVLLRMYVRSRTAGPVPQEDTLDSPLAALNLLSYSSTGRTYESRMQARPELPVEIVAFAASSMRASVYSMPASPTFL